LLAQGCFTRVGSIYAAVFGSDHGRYMTLLKDKKNKRRLDIGLSDRSHIDRVFGESKLIGL